MRYGLVNAVGVLLVTVAACGTAAEVETGQSAPSDRIPCETHEECGHGGACTKGRCTDGECVFEPLENGSPCDGGTCKEAACEEPAAGSVPMADASIY